MRVVHRFTDVQGGQFWRAEEYLDGFALPAFIARLFEYLIEKRNRRPCLRPGAPPSA